MGEFALGQPVPRFEDPRLLRGGGRYVDDMVLPRQAYGHVLRSPHAHARIRAIDTSRAEGGARRIGRADRRADWRQSGWGDLPVAGRVAPRPDGAPVYRHPFPALAQDRVRWVGDYVAFVVAETRHQAADAAELIEVDYEPLPAVVVDRGGDRARMRRASGTTARTTSASSTRSATRRRSRPPSAAPPASSSAGSSSTG